MYQRTARAACWLLEAALWEAYDSIHQGVMGWCAGTDSGRQHSLTVLSAGCAVSGWNDDP